MKGAYRKINIKASAAYITPNDRSKINISEKEGKGRLTK
jgi:hypothetical protein